MRKIYEDSEFVSNPGNRIHIIYSPKVAKDGTIDLVESGKEDLVEIIGSFAESTDINIILNRVKQGDMSALQQRVGSYGDFTKVPETFAEVLQLQIDSNNLFNKLPQDVKDKFNNDPSQFFAQSGTEEWQKKLGDVLPEQYRYKDSEVKVEESAE